VETSVDVRGEAREHLALFIDALLHERTAGLGELEVLGLQAVEPGAGSVCKANGYAAPGARWSLLRERRARAASSWCQRSTWLSAARARAVLAVFLQRSYITCPRRNSNQGYTRLMAHGCLVACLQPVEAILRQ
jgi:hypothetical protein